MNFTTNRCFGYRLRLSPGLRPRAVAILTAVLICCTSFVASTTAQDADEPVDEMKLAIKVAEFQEQLAGTSIKDRDAAEASLIELGVKTLDYLDPVTSETPPEMIERLGRVRKALETLVVTRATQPKLVTLNGEFSVNEAAEKITAMTGNKIVWPEGLDDGKQEQKITLELEKASFWQAIKQLETKAKLRDRARWWHRWSDNTDAGRGQSPRDSNRRQWHFSNQRPAGFFQAQS